MAGGAIWLVGCGNMGGAMLRGWLGQGIDPARITVISPRPKNLPAGVAQLAEAPAEKTPDILVLAVKPQKLAEVLTGWRAGAPRLLVSVLAGVESDVLAQSFGAAQVVRAMPNLPSAIGKGVTTMFSASGDADVRAEAEALMAPLGLVEWLAAEEEYHAVTALAGCGPGFLFRFIDALAEAAVALGVPPAQARRLAVATVEGSALLAASSDESPAVLADRVASPGGVTREGLNVLDEGDALKKLLAATLKAAAEKNKAMAAAARG